MERADVLRTRQRQRVPKSCIACLRGKRACDRNQPSCTRCWQKQQECIYRTAPFEKPRLSGSSKRLGKVSQEQSQGQSEDVSPLSRLNEATSSSSHNDTSMELAYNDMPLSYDTADGLLSPSQRHKCQSTWLEGGAARLPGSPSQDQDHSECTQSKHIQTALTGLLHPVAEVLFQDPEKGKQSIPEFRQQALALIPAPKEVASYLGNFRRFLRPALPALFDEQFLATAEDFLLDTNMETRGELSLSWLAVSLMMIAIGKELAVEDRGGLDDPRNGAWLKASALSSDKPQSDAFLFAAHQALSLVSFHGSPTLQTIYCQLLMGLYLLQTERAATYWPILGSIARQAQAIGLHVEAKRAVPDQQLRRQIWWAIVQQDVLLSSVFRLPLAVSNFSCQPTNPKAAHEDNTSCFQAQAQFTILERRHLMGNMDQEWNKDQLDRFKADVLVWYRSKPEGFSVSLDDQCRIIGESVEVQMRGKTVAAIEAVLDHFNQLQYTLLTLYRSRLQDKDVRLREESYMMCANVIHNIVTSLGVMMDLLGILQVGNIWLRIFYVFHAGVTCAYLAVTRSNSKLGHQARLDLEHLTTLCRRLPQRYKGLQTINDTFTVLLEQVRTFNDGKGGSAPLDRTIHSNLTSSNHGDFPSSSDCSNACPSSMQTAPSADVGTQSAPNEDLFSTIKLGEGDGSWFNTFPGPFGPSDLLPGPQASGEEILTFWNQYLSSPSQIDDLQFG